MTLTDHLKLAEDGLLTALQAQADLTGVIVQLGDPGDSPVAEVVWIIEEAQADWNPDVTGASASAPTFQEVYLLGVNVLVVQSGNDYLKIRDRASALAVGVEKAVAANPSLNAGVTDAYIQSAKRSTGATQEGRGILYEIRIRAWSYIA